MENKKLPELLTRQELAAYLRVSTHTLRNYEIAGKIQPVRVGLKKYYQTTEISKLLSNGEKK